MCECERNSGNLMFLLSFKVQYPVLWSHEEFIHSFDRFIDALHLPKVKKKKKTRVFV